MLHLNIPWVARHAQQAALERLRRLSSAGLDVASFLNEVNRVVCQIVPNGTHAIEAPFWYPLDPDSHLVTSIYGQGCDVDAGDYMRWDLLADDVMKTADVLNNSRGVQTLHEVTEGHRSAVRSTPRSWLPTVWPRRCSWPCVHRPVTIGARRD